MTLREKTYTHRLPRRRFVEISIKGIEEFVYLSILLINEAIMAKKPINVYGIVFVTIWIICTFVWFYLHIDQRAAWFSPASSY